MKAYPFCRKIARALLMLLLFIYLSACQSNSGRQAGQGISEKNAGAPLAFARDTIPNLTCEQEAALEALNTLQVNMEEVDRLYSTFPDLDQPFYPPDTVIVLSQSEFLMALEHFLRQNGRFISEGDKQKLARTAALAQEEYRVLICHSSKAKRNEQNEWPLTGVWVIPNILDRRDLIIRWD